jgi:fumarate reductase subunit D
MMCHTHPFAHEPPLRPPPPTQRMLVFGQHEGSWLLGVLVLAVGILLPLGLAASRNKLLQQAWEKATGKTV